MINNIILSYVTFIYFTGFVLYLFMMIMGKGIFGKLATFVCLMALGAHSLAIILRWVESYHLGIGHAPFSNLYESLMFFASTIVLLYLIVELTTNYCEKHAIMNAVFVEFFSFP